MHFLPIMCTLGIIIDSNKCFEKNIELWQLRQAGQQGRIFRLWSLELIIIPKLHIFGKKCINILEIIQNFRTI